MINNLERFLKGANVLLETLNDYDKVTDRLAALDLSPETSIEELSYTIDDIQSIIDERERIKTNAEAAQQELLSAIGEIEQEDKEDFELINCVFNGEEVKYALTGDRRLAKDVIFKLLSVQRIIAEKDTAILERFSAKKDEIKDKLKDLQDDKKKLDFLNLTATGSQDSTGFNV